MKILNELLANLVLCLFNCNITTTAFSILNNVMYVSKIETNQAVLLLRSNHIHFYYRIHVNNKINTRIYYLLLHLLMFKNVR